jgi:alanine racemase
VNRRAFLERAFAGAAPALLSRSDEPRRAIETFASNADTPTSDERTQSTPAEPGFDPWIEVNAAHLRHNAQQVATRAGGRPILAVIKNNGYGLGVVQVARALEPQAAIAGFAVVKVDEAIRLRDAGVKKPIVMMGPFTAEQLYDLGARDISPMVYTPVGDAIDRTAAKLGRPLHAHVCIDTGIGRVGVPFDRAEPLVADLAKRRGLVIDGVQMTFTEDPEFDREQLKRFVDLTAGLSAAGFKIGRRHAASTYTLFQHEDAWLDMVRPGMAIFGIYPETKFRGQKMPDLRPAVALRTRVVYVKQLAAGTPAGYERAYVAKQPTWIATLPVGHADGWPRVAAKGGRVRINGRLYPVIASVSASHTIVEIGAEESVKAGDVATLFDWTDGSRPEDLAASCGASVYDLTMHLSPLLARRVVE